MKQEIFEYFSCHNWGLVPSRAVDKIHTITSLTSYEVSPIWEDSFVNRKTSLTNFNHLEILRLSTAISGWHLVEVSGNPNRLSKLLKQLSAFGKTYEFEIDIWIPIMSFKVFYKCKESRLYISSLKNGEIEEEEEGHPEDFEFIDLDIPSSPNGYDYFFLPLAIMSHFRVKEEFIIKSFKMPCRLFKILD